MRELTVGFILLLAASAFADLRCPSDYSIEKLFSHTNCNQFYQCVHGVPLVRTCKDGLYFNPNTLECDFEENVLCGQLPQPEPEPAPEPPVPEPPIIPVPIPPPVSYSCPEDWTVELLYPHEECNQFYKCYRGVPVAIPCPSGLYYNQNTWQCDWPDNVDCDNRDVVAPEPPAPEPPIDPVPVPPPVSNFCPEDWTIEFLFPHEECNQFYKCYRGEPVAIPCPSGLNYNQNTWQCDWPDNVDCDNRDVVIPEPPAPEPPVDPVPPPVSQSCPDDWTVELLLPHEECNQFYKCYRGEPVAIPCPSGLYYNQNTWQCDWPDNVDCDNRDVVVPGPSSPNPPASSSAPPTVGGNPCPEDWSEERYLLHENCDQFYQCYRGEPVVISCPSGLNFNPMNWQCDWPDNVNCDNRDVYIPSPNPSPNPDPAPPVVEKSCPEDWNMETLLPHDDCNKFYQCTLGEFVVFECPPGLFYNPNDSKCDWPDNVNCRNRN